ncbi:MAG: ABC transporter ATP-binding protein [Acidobacteriota bacterium]
MMGKQQRPPVIFKEVSRFYGEVLGVNRVTFELQPGITSLVGPNGSGKSTLMNLMFGLLRPTRGTITVFGVSPYEPEKIFSRIGYCAQYDSFPRGSTGNDFIYSILRIRDFSEKEARELTARAAEMVGLTDAMHRRVAGYSKGMRQRIKLAQALSHKPELLVLDEPLNGLDPLARADMIALFRQLAGRGAHIMVSSHILHEVDMISDQVIMLHGGYVVAEGQIQSVRSEMSDHPVQILVRCSRMKELAAELVRTDQVIEIKIQPEKQALLLKVTDIEAFHGNFHDAVRKTGAEIETIIPADENAQSIYEYLINS